MTFIVMVMCFVSNIFYIFLFFFFFLFYFIIILFVLFLFFLLFCFAYSSLPLCSRYYLLIIIIVYT